MADGHSYEATQDCTIRILRHAGALVECRIERVEREKTVDHSSDAARLPEYLRSYLSTLGSSAEYASGCEEGKLLRLQGTEPQAIKASDVRWSPHFTRRELPSGTKPFRTISLCRLYQLFKAIPMCVAVTLSLNFCHFL